MAPATVRLEEGFGTEGVVQLEGVGQMEGVGHMEGPERTVQPVVRASAAASAPKKTARAAMPGMRSAIVWAEILGKPKALRGRR